MAEVLLFHHVQGFTPGVSGLADRFRTAGHTVHAPDLFDGRTFATLPEGMSHLRELGFGTVIERGDEAAEGLPPGLVYVGLSMGVDPGAEARADPARRRGRPVRRLVDTGRGVRRVAGGRAGAGARHGSRRGVRRLRRPRRGEGAGGRRRRGAVPLPGDRHLFVDDSLADYDEPAAEQFVERALAFLDAAG